MKNYLIIGILLISVGCSNTEVTTSEKESDVSMNVGTPITVSKSPIAHPAGPVNKTNPDILGIGTGEKIRATSIHTVNDFSDQMAGGQPSDCTPDPVLPPLPTVNGQIFRGISQSTSAGGSSMNPDTCIAVGPNDIIQCTNGQIAFYDKTTEAMYFRQRLDDFFPNVFPGNGTDPRVIFDHYENRFVVTCLDIEGINNNTAFDAKIHIAVSENDGDPEGVWLQYQFNNTFHISHPDSDFGDQPELGFDENGYYLSAFVIGTVAPFEFGSVFYAIEKNNALFDVQTPTHVNRITYSGSKFAKVAHSFGGANNPLAVALKPDQNVLTTLAFNNPFASNSNNFTLTPFDMDANAGIAPYDVARINVVNGGITFRHDIAPVQLQKAVYRDGKLWVCYVVKKPGFGQTSGSNSDRAVVRWHEIDMQNWPGGFTTPVELQTGDLDYPAENTFFPALYTNSSGDTGFVFGRSGASRLFSVWRAGRNSLTTSGQLETGTELQLDISTREIGLKPGDYFYIVLDPDGETFWVTGETYVSCEETGATRWETVISSFTVPDP